jgi:hypothetical protein
MNAHAFGVFEHGGFTVSLVCSDIEYRDDRWVVEWSSQDPDGPPWYEQYVYAPHTANLSVNVGDEGTFQMKLRSA